MSNIIIPFDQIQSMAMQVTKSGFFGSVKTEAQAMTLMLIASAEGIHPMRAVMEYDIIDGKPHPKTTTVMSKYMESGGKIEWIESNSNEARAKFSHPRGTSITIGWTIERAKTAGLTGKDNWKKYPDQMLRARTISEGIRASFPHSLGGMYTSDEMQDVGAFEAKPIATADDTFIEVEEVIEVPKTTLKAEKIILTQKLRDLQLSNNDIKGFVEYYGISDKLESIEALNHDEAALIERVKEFEAQLN